LDFEIPERTPTVQFLNVVLYILLVITSLFLICLVLIQRGKGGGLAGAFGGAGGSSAFGTKAGDVFTRVTMISAGVWIALNMLLVVLSNHRPSAWPTAPSSSAKGSFTPSKPDLDKAGTPGESIEKGTGVPLPKSKDSTGEPAVPISGGSPAAPLPLPDAPFPSRKP
jgi:preprotein translocase subunit SecG